MSYYPDRISEHFLNPRNVGEADGANAAGEAWSPVCGALLRISLRIDAGSKAVTEARFKTVGCGFLIAAASALTETICGMAVSRAATLPLKAITDWFEELPAERRHCASLCREALLAALADYHNVAREEWNGDEALICTCFCVSEKTIEREIQARSLSTIKEVTRACHAGGGCGSCHPLIEEMLDDYRRAAVAQALGREACEP